MADTALPASTFRHLLLTRFNIWSPFGGSDTIRLNTNYLEHRLALFERYCLPSVVGQTCRSFRWVIFLDRETPDAIKQRVAAHAARHDVMVPVYLSRDDGMVFDSRVGPFIPTRAIEDRRYLLTTRLDNDDALATHFVSNVQSAVTDGDDFLNLPCGYRYVEASNKVYEIVHPSNPFASRLEDRQRGEPETVLNVDHTKLHTAGRVRQVGGGAGWIIVVHGANVSNGYDPLEKRVARSVLGASFAMPAEIVNGPELGLGIAADNAARRLRTGLAAPALRIVRGVCRRARSMKLRQADGGSVGRDGATGLPQIPS